jgi:acyl carrier protein
MTASGPDTAEEKGPTMPTDRAAILAALQDAVCEVMEDEAPELTESTTLTDVDSLDLLEILMIVEERFDLTIDVADLPAVEHLGEVIDVIERLLAAKGDAARAR